ncbi:hypothetical protein BDB01DRAFT_785853 [Pilobolus umbonatus]|nr:hypothetical protein BDB01DRAFT_785853 [Pilobolus umbonatus]
MPYPYMPNGNTPYPMSPNHDPSGSPHIDYSGNTSPSHNYYAPNMNNYQNSPGYEANGMVYYGIDPSAMYPPQPYYYYPPPMPVMGGPSMMPYEPTEGNDYAEGWGSPPDITETEVEWRQDSVNNMNYYYYSHNHIY